jgi:hypothetical protein
LTNWFEVEFILLKVLKLQPSELDKMEFYRAEILMENLKNFNDEEEGRRKKEEEKQGLSDPMKGAADMMRSSQRSLPNFSSPSMPNLSMPNISLPNFKF